MVEPRPSASVILVRDGPVGLESFMVRRHAQSALHDTIETSEGLWLSPAQALAPEYHTVYATAQHLRRLEPFTSVAALMAFARTKPIRMVSPELVEGAEGRRVIIRPEIAESW